MLCSDVARSAAAALSFMPAYAEEIDFTKIPDVRIFKGDETIGYRDPAAWYEDGVFHVGESAEDIYAHAQAATERLIRS